MRDINCLQVSICQPTRLSVSGLTKCIKKAKRPASNINKGEFKALQELKADIDITILPADKGRTTVVLNAKDYESKLSTLLSDYNTLKCYRTPRRNSRELTEMIQRWQREDPIPTPLKHVIYTRRNQKDVWPT